MAEFTTSTAQDILLQEIQRLTTDNRKLNRQLSNTNVMLDRARSGALAQSNLSAILSDEKARREKQLALLLRNSPDIIVLLDSNGLFVFCTDSFLENMGIASYGLIDMRPFHDVLAAAVDEPPLALLENGIATVQHSGEKQEIETRLLLAGGTDARDFLIGITPFKDEKGIMCGTLLVFHDMTEILRAKELAEAASKAKSDFLATMSHEIRTPMNAIMGVADMLRKTALTAHQQSLLQNIHNSSTVLLDIINDILDLSKIEAGKLDLLEDYYSLTEQLARTKSICEIMFSQKNVVFRCNFAPNLPRIVYGDEKRIGQILSNILNNAMKYTIEGAVDFTAYLDDSGKVCFDIRDTGIGIKQKDIARLFKPFEQFDSVWNKNVVGTGLGLAITKRLCAMMNGEISVESEYRRGSCFTVRLGLRTGSDGDLPAANLSDFKFTAPHAKVLVVDDIDINLIVAVSMLENFDITPDTAANGKQALTLAAQKTYDIILMDHMMPEMDGIETTLQLRAETGTQTPIIALTANTVTGARELFMQNGLNDFLAKPLGAGALGTCLAKWLPRELIRVTGEDILEQTMMMR